MNKQRYLAELQRLLVFMTEEDREKTVHYYGEMFDAAGEAGELALLNQLGSPTKAAIQLSRGYEPGQLSAVLPQIETLAAAQPEPEPKTEAAAPAPTEDALWGDLPSFELPDLDIEPESLPDEQAPETGQPPEAAGFVAIEEAARPAKPVEVTVPAETAEVPTGDNAPQPPEAETASPAEPEESISPAKEPESQEEPPESAVQAAAAAPDAPRPEPSDEPWRANKQKKKTPAQNSPRTMPLGVGIPLFILVMIVLGVPLAAVCLGIMAALLIPGGAGLVGAYLAAVGGLWCLSYMADAILMFGLAFLILALALIVLWLGIWADVKLASGYVQAVSWLADELLGGQVTEDE